MMTLERDQCYQIGDFTLWFRCDTPEFSETAANILRHHGVPMFEVPETCEFAFRVGSSLKLNPIPGEAQALAEHASGLRISS